MSDYIAALKALRQAIAERVAYIAQFLATTPLPPDGNAPDHPRPDLAEMQRLDALVHDRGTAYDLAWNDAGQPGPHYQWEDPQAKSE